ncbi:MAG TPA: ABC transporter ATP-binding protein [Candidatus Kapabacteria bacterium]|nr:ABC transporter ATP-binding protein [Candidatus Kapabacteria bacterium]
MLQPRMSRGGRASLEDKSQPTWRERVAALRYVPPLLRLVWETHRGYTVAMVALRLLRSAFPVATLWAGKLIIDEVVLLQGHGGDTTRLWKLVGLEIAIVLVSDVLARGSAIVESLLGDLFSNHISVRLMEHAATLDLYHFEDPAFYDQMERARRQTVGRIGLLATLLGMGQSVLTLISLGAALLAYNPWLLLLLAAASLPGLLGETHFASLQYSLLYRWTPQRRQLDYLRYVGASNETAKEVQMFGLSGWLVERYRLLSDLFYRENRRLSIRRGVIGAALSTVATGGYYGAYVMMILRAVSGAISLGTLTFLAASFKRGHDLIESLLSGAGDIYQQALYLKDLFDFFAMRPSITSLPAARSVPEVIREGFLFENVGFRYPGSERWAVRNVNFRLRPGERIAFVGENGAGKTTLTKLIARLYDPSEGRILLDGVDLREYDLASLRRTISVIFQDFVRYDLRFDENIAVGGIDAVEEYLNRPEGEAGGPAAGAARSEAVPAAIRSAAEKSLASTLLARFAGGYRQMLGRRFEGGMELSGGEWQKVALARAYMRECQVLILDEPTAALDARAEYEVFTRFSELVAGRTAIIISHRFSTVRMADRIVVLKDGTVVENGTHDELLALEGLYAELFEMQAEGYR